MSKRGRLFVISAPSGSGKTTLCQKLILSLQDKRELIRSVSVTTRKPRKGEQEGRDYFFISVHEFITRKRKGQFLEWAKVLSNFYGTPGDFVQRHLNHGEDVLLSIDVQGARQIKSKMSEAVLIFILPPSLGELEKRLQKRKTESKREINRRLQLAKREMGRAKEYNYLVVNDKISKALAKLKEIINLERRRKR